MSTPRSNSADDKANITDVVEAWLQTSGVAHQITHAEGPVLVSLVKGLSEAQTAAHLKLSRHTVHTHVRHLYQKMQVTSRAEFISKIFCEVLARSASTRR
jgi:DNA-binding CsgD family transcriptional regulator